MVKMQKCKLLTEGRLGLVSQIRLIWCLSLRSQTSSTPNRRNGISERREIAARFRGRKSFRCKSFSMFFQLDRRIWCLRLLSIDGLTRFRRQREWRILLRQLTVEHFLFAKQQRPSPVVMTSEETSTASKRINKTRVSNPFTRGFSGKMKSVCGIT